MCALIYPSLAVPRNTATAIPSAPLLKSPNALRSVATGFGAPPGRRLLVRDEAVLAVRQDNAVGLQGVLGGDEAVLDVAADELGVALERVSVAPAAGELQDQALPGGDALLAFGVEGFAGGRADRTCGAVPAAEHPGGLEPGAVVHGGEGPGLAAVLAADTELHLLAEAAAVAARALGVRAQLSLVHDNGGDALYHFRRDAADAAWEGSRREAIALGPGAHPTAGEEDVGEGLAVRLLARDLGVPQAVGPLGEDPLRDDLRQGAVDEPRQKMPDDVPPAHRRGVFGVQDAPLGRRDAHGAEAAVVVGHVGADGALDPEGGIGGGVVQHDVDAALALGRGTLVVHDDLVPLDAHRDDQLYRLVEAVGRGLVLVDAVEYPGDGVAHRVLGAGADLVGERLYVCQVELLHHLQQARPADLVAPGLGVEVADDLEGRPHVRPDDAQQLLVGLAPGEEAAYGQEEPLLVDLPAVGPEAPAAEVKGVAAVAEIGDELVPAEDRRHHGEVVEVARGLPRVVRDEGVAGPEGLDRERFEKVVGARRHRVDVARGTSHGLGDHPAAAVEEAGREVAGLAHHAREGGPHQGPCLLLDDRDQTVPEDLEQDRVQTLRAHLSHLTIRFRHSSTSARESGPTITVDSRSSTTAGPSKD